MNPSRSDAHRDTTLEQRIDALPVNAAHRNAALADQRAAMVAADRAVAFTHGVLSLAGTIRTALGGFKRRIGSGLM